MPLEEAVGQIVSLGNPRIKRVWHRILIRVAWVDLKIENYFYFFLKVMKHTGPHYMATLCQYKVALFSFSQELALYLKNTGFCRRYNFATQQAMFSIFVPTIRTALAVHLGYFRYRLRNSLGDSGT